MDISQMGNLEEMGEDELRAECAQWRNIWTWLPENVRYWVSHTGWLIRIVGRDFKGRLGTLGSVQWEMVSVDVAITTEETDFTVNRRFREEKTLNIAKGGITFYEMIMSREELEEAYTAQEEEPILKPEGDLPF